MTQTCTEADCALLLGTRGSALALAQTALVIDCLQSVDPPVTAEARVIQTVGDLDKTSPLTVIGGHGVFTNELERRILCGEVDAAVHSAKDLPTALHPDVPIVAFPDRADPRDVLVSRHGVTLDQLPENPVIGTSSRRREAQIARLRPDARFANLRGNVDTRLRKSEGVEFDAIVLAAAGVSRMGWLDRVSEYFAVERIVPSPGQGAIAVQALAGSAAAARLAAIDDPRVSGPVEIERAYLAAIGSGCTLPVGALASAHPDGYRLVAMLANADGNRMVFADEVLAPHNEREHAACIAARLMADIGTPAPPRVWNGWTERAGDLAGARVMVTRPRAQAQALMAALALRGAEPLSFPTIRIEPLPDTSALDAELRAAARGEFAWLAFTSANAVAIVAERLAKLGIKQPALDGVKVAAVGAATAVAAREAGWHVALVPESSTAETLAAEIQHRVEAGARVLYPRSAIGRDALPDALRAGGIDVVTIDAYRTVPEPDVDPAIVARIRRGEIDALAFASPSSVRNLSNLFLDQQDVLRAIPAICAGPITAKAARDAGMIVAEVSADPGAAAMADAVAAHWQRQMTGSHAQENGHMATVNHAMKGSTE